MTTTFHIQKCFMKVNFNILLFTSSEQDRMDYGRNQIWMAKKLKTFFYNNVLMIYIRYEEILHFYAGARSILHP